MPGSSRSRRWSITLNNPSAEQLADLRRCFESRDITQCAGYQLECGESGTEHIQAFAVFFNPRTMLGAKVLLQKTDGKRSGIHLEISKGSPSENAAYCSKSDTRVAGTEYVQFGDLEAAELQSGQGSRSDLDRIAQLLRDGTPFRDVLIAHPSQFIRYGNGIQKWWECFSAPTYAPRTVSVGEPGEVPRVLWFWGKTGTGKTRAILQEAEAIGEEIYWKDSSKWWSNYTMQGCVALDDFRAMDMPFATLLRLLDVYPLRVEKKNGHCDIGNLKLCIITSPNTPEEVFSGLVERDSGKIAQLLRRITEIRHFGDDEEAPPVYAPCFKAPLNSI